jgi:hypothetical protein
MVDLKTILTDPVRRPQVVRDCAELVEAEVASKGGLSGLALKTAFKMAKAFKPGIIPDSMDGMLDDFAERLDPFYQAYAASPGMPLPDYFVSRRSEIAEALLAITDGRSQRTKHTTLKKAYESVRGQGKKHLEDAAPALGRLVEKHTKP